jgi:monoamine oxidase
VPGGMQQFVDGLAKPVEYCIRTNTCVTSINYVNKDKIVVETSSGEAFEAEYVVVTSSLGYLKSKQLKFEPELPADKISAIDRSTMGLYVKVLLQFPSVFWPEDAALIGQIDEKTAGMSAASSDQHVYFPTLINYHYAKGYPVLESQLVGDQAARALATMTDEEIAHALFLQLQNTFGADIPSPVGHFLTRYII